ncbi:hypothetical protein [Thermopetrobacter sp. TC1]|uniref:hypothetical protein n=1 Tax=Thermopetrobacter sp. TC1 TaxID=1495045 RepID=UPI0005708285|nr:hypothetical protein [Thermopetrobacter sp. TC1]
MHNLSACFVLGFHGCDRRVAERLIRRRELFRRSENSYDWLGHGIYFWLENPRRACEWARERARLQKEFVPAVVGAIINLGNCLDLTTSAGIEHVKLGYLALKGDYAERGVPLPENSRAHEKDGDRLIRRLDCVVINQTCQLLEDNGTPVDTVKGIFTEGGWAYPGAGFKERTHTQICVRNPECILGVFYPPREALGEDALLCNDTPS